MLLGKRISDVHEGFRPGAFFLFDHFVKIVEKKRVPRFASSLGETLENSDSFSDPVEIPYMIGSIYSQDASDTM